MEDKACLALKVREGVNGTYVRSGEGKDNV